MRTKTLALSAVLGMLGSAAVMGANVYSVNAVGYINVTMQPGFNIITCPLLCGADPANSSVSNDLNVLFPNPLATTPYAGAQVFQLTPGGGYSGFDSGYTSTYGGGWANGGATVTLNPGQAIFFQNPNPIHGANMSATFVGTVPTGTLTMPLVPGYNMVGSMVPVSGDLVTSSITALHIAQNGDSILFFDPTPAGSFQAGFIQDAYSASATYGTGWTGGPGPNFGVNNDPQTVSVYEGFFYNNGQATTENWVETFSINP
jgi:hypothetical protein